MSPAASSPWFWIDPSLVSLLVDRVAVDRVFVDGISVALDGRPLLAASAARAIELSEGKLVVCTTVEALIAADARDAALGLVAAANATGTEVPSVLNLVGRGQIGRAHV